MTRVPSSVFKAITVELSLPHLALAPSFASTDIPSDSDTLAPLLVRPLPITLGPRG